MRTRWGHIKQLLEAKADKKALRIHTWSWERLSDTAKSRFVAWVKQKEKEGFRATMHQRVGTLGTWVIDVASSEPRSFYTFTVFIYDPIHPKVRPGFMSASSSKDVKRQLAAEMRDVISPSPDASGAWWADVNYYPIRPVFDGEDASHKPDPTWTIVDGATGDVVSE